jgi:hypothetical protein
VTGKPVQSATTDTSTVFDRAYDALHQFFRSERSNDPTKPAGGQDIATHAMTFGLDDLVGGVLHGVGTAARTGSFGDFTGGYHEYVTTKQRQRDLAQQIYPATSTAATGVGALTTGKLYAPEATLKAAGQNLVVGGAQGGLPAVIDDPSHPTEAIKPALTGAATAVAGPYVGSVIPEVGMAVTPSVSSISSRSAAGTALRERAPALPIPQPGATPAIPLADPYEASATAAAGRINPATGQRTGGAVGAVRAAGDVLDTEENRLWNTPALSNPTGMSSTTSKRYVNDEVNRIVSDQPGTAHMFDPLNQGDGAKIRAAIADLNAMPDQLAANQLNMISSRLRKIQRTTNDDNVARVAGKLADRVSQGIYDAPEARLNPTTVSNLLEARDFTQRQADFYANNSFKKIFQRNDSGHDWAQPTEAGLNNFYDFNTGVPKVGQISDLRGFLDDIKTSWRNLGGTAGSTYDPAIVGHLQNELTNNTRDWVMAKVATETSKMVNGERSLDLNKLSDWMQKNRGMLRTSGTFTNDQMDALHYLGETAGKIQGSPTYQALTSGDPKDKTWLSLFAGSALKRTLVGGALGAGLETAVTAVAPNLFGAIAGQMPELLGLAGGFGVGARTFNNMMANLYRMPRQQAQEWIMRGIQNPEIAADLMKTAGRTKAFSDATKQWFAAMGATETGDLQRRENIVGQGAEGVQSFVNRARTPQPVQ